MPSSCCSRNFSSSSLGSCRRRYSRSSCGSSHPSNLVYTTGLCSSKPCQQGASLPTGCQKICSKPLRCQTSSVVSTSFQNSSCLPKPSAICKPTQMCYIESLGCGPSSKCCPSKFWV